MKKTNFAEKQTERDVIKVSIVHQSYSNTNDSTESGLALYSCMSKKYGLFSQFTHTFTIECFHQRMKVNWFSLQFTYKCNILVHDLAPMIPIKFLHCGIVLQYQLQCCCDVSTQPLNCCESSEIKHCLFSEFGYNQLCE